jgi:hypothetical protein
MFGPDAGRVDMTRRIWMTTAVLVLAWGCSAAPVDDWDTGRTDDGGGTDGDVPEGGEATDEGGVCTPEPERCDEVDNDCDDLTDEDFDLRTDMANCGECGAACAPPHADGACETAVCVIVLCHSGWVDANNNSADGCEYECIASSSSESPGDGTCSDGVDNDCDTRIDGTDTDCAPCVPEFCDALDNDCDGLTDEDFDLDFDAVNCGGCGTVCAVRPNALPICVFGVCDIACTAGWEDRDGRQTNGCEATCVPAAAPNEAVCDGVDDDCDGLTDEDYLSFRCGTGLCERDSVCHRAEERCVPRSAPADQDTTCDNIDDDCDGTVDEDWVPTTCVGACVGTATCIEGVAACGTPAAADTVCDGIDEDCDGVADEDYETYTCGLGECMRTSMCLLGMERCREGTPATETCNGRDDDCDGETDEAPTAPDSLCPPAANGSVDCVSGRCTMVSCVAGWFDADGSSANGCECELEASEGRDATCATAFDLGSFPDTGADLTIRGKVAPTGDEDWFQFRAPDNADTTCDAYHVDVRFTANPGSVFRMDVHRGSCGPTSCTNIVDGYDWYTDYRSGSGTTAVGECGCRTASTVNFNICNDDTATYYVRVYRAPGSSPDCAEYAIRITNGVF